MPRVSLKLTVETNMKKIQTGEWDGQPIYREQTVAEELSEIIQDNETK